MFEKEAEEYSTSSKVDYINNIAITLVQQAFKEGAEFGYNKANEWHYVKDGDLPKDEEYKWCISLGGYPYIAKYEELFVSWRNQENKDVLCPYVWKEIIPPKE